MPTQEDSTAPPTIEITSAPARSRSPSTDPSHSPVTAHRSSPSPPPQAPSGHARVSESSPGYPPKHATFAALPTDSKQRRLHLIEIPRLVNVILKHRWFAWVGPKLTWSHFRPVIRCALAVWIGLVLQLIRPVEATLGYAAFFVIIVGFMVPPHLPVVQSLEIFLNLYFFAGLAWAWTALGVFIAHAVREPTDPAKVAAAEARLSDLRSNPKLFQSRIIFDATYLEAKSAIVCAVFLSVGTGAFLWHKIRTQPSPATFPLVLSCILMDVAFTTAALYPNAQYTSGLLFFLPMAVQGGIAVLASCLIFPESVGHSFQAKFGGVLNPLQSAMQSISSLFEGALSDGPFHPDDSLGTGDLVSMDRSMRRLDAWAERSKMIRTQLLSSLAGIPPLKAQQRYLLVDISYGRLSGTDMRELFDLLAIVQTRSGGMAFFFDVIVTNARHTHIDSSAFSVHQVNQSRPGSRAPSVRDMSDSRRNSLDTDAEMGDDSPHDVAEHGNGSTHDSGYFGSKRFHVPNFLHGRSGSPHHQQRDSHVSLLDHLRKVQQPVGVYESQRYMDVEKAYSPDAEQVLEQLNLLAGASLPLVESCGQALKAASNWLRDVNRDRVISPIFPKQGQKCRIAEKNDILALEEASGNLQSGLDDFHIARLGVIRPFRYMFDPAQPSPEDVAFRKKHYRGLFQNFVAQYHLIEFAEALLRLLRTIERLDKARQKKRLWYPRLSTLLGHIKGSHTEKHLTDGDDGHDNDAAFDAEDSDEMLGEAHRRDPEYSPWESPTLNLLSRIATIPDLLTSRSFMFAVKACILGALTTLPQFIASSAAFYYYNRGIWVTIMAQLTLAIYSGDTTAAWLGRVVASFWGCVLGMVAWYIGSGSGHGNAYGLGATCAVAFPIAMFFRIHFPGPVLTAVMLPVTFGLVIGYSYLNGTFVELTYASWGFDVAWRRFVSVLIGITAAWIFSYLPPVYSRKRAIRSSYATIIGVSGSLLCDILSYANNPHYHLQENVECRSNLLTWRSKLTKLAARHANAKLEYSLRGRWPEERYLALREILEDLLSLLAQFNHVLGQLDRPWRKALLDRTRFSDPIFLGDVLAVLTMCSSGLRAGTALPQITPAPLIERFRKGKYRGLELPHDPTDQSGEVPSLVTVDVLESENYMRYALGTTTTFSIMARLDRLVVTCKTLLGENYHVSGLHFERDLEA